MSNSLYDMMARRNPQAAMAMAMHAPKTERPQAVHSTAEMMEPVAVPQQDSVSVAITEVAENAAVADSSASDDAVAALRETQCNNYDEILDLLGFEDLPEVAVEPAAQAKPVLTGGSVFVALENATAAAQQCETVTPVKAEAAPASETPAIQAVAEAQKTVAAAKPESAVFSGNNSLAQMMMRRREAGQGAPAAKPAAAAADPLCGLPMEDCTEGHKEWSRQLTEVLRGRAEAAEAGDGHTCPLGRWLDGEGRALSRYREFDLLRQAHDRFHECASRIIEQHKKGSLAEAIRMLRSDLPKLADAIGEQALALRKAVRGF